MKFYKFLTLTFSMIIILTMSTSSLSAKSWDLDLAHSTLGFSINHFFTPVKGTFDDFDLDINFDPNDLGKSSFDLAVKISSVSTGNEKRDGHLQTKDFFDSEQYPVMTFKSSKIISKGNNMYLAYGKLMIKNVEKDIELPFKVLGMKVLPEDMQKKMGGLKEVVSFQASFSLNRNDYTVGTGSWTATAVVGDEVTIDIAVEGQRR